jgi:hypothetical protein
MGDKHYIAGEVDGIPLYLKASGPIDFSQDYEWTEDYSQKITGTFDQMCEIIDEYFEHGLFNSISGIIFDAESTVA